MTGLSAAQVGLAEEGLHHEAAVGVDGHVQKVLPNDARQLLQHILGGHRHQLLNDIAGLGVINQA